MDIKISGPDDEKKREYKTLIHAKTISSCNQSGRARTGGKKKARSGSLSMQDFKGVHY